MPEEDVDPHAGQKWRRAVERDQHFQNLDIIGAARAGAGQSLRVAQGSMEVVCQSLVSKQQLVRVVKEGEKCFREVMSPVRGTVDSREEVPCDTQCKAG